MVPLNEQYFLYFSLLSPYFCSVFVVFFFELNNPPNYCAIYNCVQLTESGKENVVSKYVDVICHFEVVSM